MISAKLHRYFSYGFFSLFSFQMGALLTGAPLCVDMARDFARAFYSSETWNQCRTGYKKSVGGLCERCLAKGLYTPGEIVHHKIHLTPANVREESVALNWANLELLCRDCHAAEHKKQSRRFVVDEYGRVTGTA